MPKVKDEYLADKKTFILECTKEVLMEKPLYLVTMRDIIKKGGFSQGVIYRYYANLDEIYVDLINMHTTDSFLEQKIDTLLDSEQTEKTILTECFIAMGEYIEELLKSIVGKIFFELLVLYSSDQEKRAAIFPKLRFKQRLEYAQKRLVEYALYNIEKGVFQPLIPFRSALLFVNVFIDGIGQRVVWDTTKDGACDPGSATDVPEMFRTLAKAVISFLEE